MDGGGRPRGRGAVRPDTWQQVGHLTGEPKTCVTGSLHRPGALHGDLALEYQTAAAARQRVYYYRDLPGATEWSFSGSTTDYPFTGGWVATDGVHGFVGADPKTSIYSSSLQRIGYLDFLDAAMFGNGAELLARDGFVVQNQFPSLIGDAPQFGSLYVWREASPDAF